MNTDNANLTKDRINVLGAQAAEAMNQIRFAEKHLAKIGIDHEEMKAALACLKDCYERLDIIRDRCYQAAR